MAKRSPPRAFFEILREERQARTEREQQQKEEVVEEEERPAPLVRRRREPGPPPPPAAAAEPPAPAERRQSWISTVKARLAEGTVTLSYFWVGILAIVFAWLCVLCIFIGTWLAGPASLPNPSREPDFPTVQAEAPTPGLLGEGGPTAPGPDTGGESHGGRQTETPVGGSETTPAGEAPGAGGTPTTPQPKGEWRVRIAGRLPLSQTEYTDKLRAYLLQHGIETELDLRQQYYYLYTSKQFATKAESDRFKETVNALKVRFARETGWRADPDAYSVQVD